MSNYLANSSWTPISPTYLQIHISPTYLQLYILPTYLHININISPTFLHIFNISTTINITKIPLKNNALSVSYLPCWPSVLFQTAFSKCTRQAHILSSALLLAPTGALYVTMVYYRSHFFSSDFSKLKVTLTLIYDNWWLMIGNAWWLITETGDLWLLITDDHW